MKKFSTSIAVFALALSPIFGYAVCSQPRPITVTEQVDVDDQGETIYDQFDDPEDDCVDEVMPATGDRILVVGDSEACAVGAYADDKVWRAKAGLGASDDVVGVWCKASTPIEYWSEQGHMLEAISEFEPTVVLVFLGTNNYGAKKAPDVEPILDLVKERDLRCVWVGNTAVRGKNWAINGLLRDAVTPTCRYFDTEADHIVLWDGIHPGASEAQRWLKDVWRTIPAKNEDGECTW